MAVEAALTEIVALGQEISEVLKDKLPGNFRFELYNLMTEINPKIKSFNNTRNDLIKQYGSTDSDGNYVVPEKEVINFTKQLNELAENKFKIKHLVSRKHLKELTSSSTFHLFKFSK